MLINQGQHIVYTDGGCYNNGDWAGAWAYLEIDALVHNIVVPKSAANNHIVKKGVGYVYDTTNNRMEMEAIIRAVRSFDIGSSIILYSDSGYCVNGHNDPSYLQRWKTNGWRTSKKSPVENRDLWEQILELDNLYIIQYNLIKGHSKDKGSPHKLWNDTCDDMCTQMRLYATKRYDDKHVKIPHDCPSDCRFKPEMCDQGGMCYRCPVILCKEPDPVVSWDEYRDDWLVEWGRFFNGETECPKLLL